MLRVIAVLAIVSLLPACTKKTADRIVTLLPSGRSYRLGNVNNDNRSITQNNNDNISCTNNIMYTANDSTYQFDGGQAAGANAGDAILHIRY